MEGRKMFAVACGLLALAAAPAMAAVFDNFDSYANGNLSGQGSWTEGNDGTSWIQVADNPAGVGKVVWLRGGDTGSGDRTVGSEAMAGMTGTITVEFDILKNAVSENTSWGVLADSDGTPVGNLARAYGTGANARGRIGAQGIVTGADALADGWNHIKIVIDTAANTDTFYMNGALLTGTNPISHAGFGGDLVQRISLHKVNLGQDVYLDNISVTPEPVTLSLLALGALVAGRRRAHA